MQFLTLYFFHFLSLSSLRDKQWDILLLSSSLGYQKSNVEAKGGFLRLATRGIVLNARLLALKD